MEFIHKVSKSTNLDKLSQDMLDAMAYMFENVQDMGQNIQAIEVRLGADIWLSFTTGFNAMEQVSRLTTDYVNELVVCHEDPAWACVLKKDCPGDPVRGERIYQKRFITNRPESLTTWLGKGFLAHALLVLIMAYLSIFHQIYKIPGMPKEAGNVLLMLTPVWVVTGVFFGSFLLVSAAYEIFGAIVQQHFYMWRGDTPFKRQNLLRRMLNGVGFGFLVMFLLQPKGVIALIKWMF